jgi:type I restriction enzyme R subunit
VWKPLIQAYSRTNRILNDKKSQGNIICFRNLKEATDEAILLYSNKDNSALETVLMKPYKNYINDFEEIFIEFRKISQSVDDIDNLKSETDKRNFVVAFGGLLKILNKLKVFTEFNYEDLNINEQEINDYQSKYLDIYDEVKAEKEENKKESILYDVEFEMELIGKDDINVAYILNLMRELDIESPSYENDKHNIINLVKTTPTLRSKLDLIDEFLNDNFPQIPKNEIDNTFEDYIDKKQEEEFALIVKEENVEEDKIKEVLSEYEYSEKLKRDLIKDAIKDKDLGFVEKRTKVKNLILKIKSFVEKFTF